MSFISREKKEENFHDSQLGVLKSGIFPGIPGNGNPVSRSRSRKLDGNIPGIPVSYKNYFFKYLI